MDVPFPIDKDGLLFPGDDELLRVVGLGTGWKEGKEWGFNWTSTLMSAKWAIALIVGRRRAFNAGNTSTLCGVAEMTVIVRV